MSDTGKSIRYDQRGWADDWSPLIGGRTRATKQSPASSLAVVAPVIHPRSSSCGRLASAQLSVNLCLDPNVLFCAPQLRAGQRAGDSPRKPQNAPSASLRDAGHVCANAPKPFSSRQVESDTIHPSRRIDLKRTLSTKPAIWVNSAATVWRNRDTRPMVIK